MQQVINYFQGEKIGSGLNGDVYSCYDDTNQAIDCAENINTMQPQYVLKVFNSKDEFQCEVNVLKELDHPNIVKVIQEEDENKFLMNYYPNGDMFDFLQKIGSEQMTEEIARYFFSQLLAAIEYIHSKDIIHRDIKLENILIDENFNLILADFGLSQRVERGQKLKQYIGTSHYMAPEIVSQNLYYGQTTDIFALGVLLFCIMVGNYPFQSQANAQDVHYKYFIKQSYIRYWLQVEKQSKKQYSEEFKSLINSMLRYDPDERITLEEIKNHPWLTCGHKATSESIKQLFENKKSDENQMDVE